MNLDKNTGLQIRMIIVMVLLGLLTIGFGTVIGFYLQSFIIPIIIVSIITFIQFFYSHKIALKSFGGRIIDESEYTELHTMVTRLSQQANMEKPNIAVAETPITNAFATGRSTSTATICVTTSLMEVLSEEELEAVIAHELAHIKNKDMIVMTIAGAIAAITSMVFRFRFFSYNSRRNGGIILFLLISIITYIVSYLLMMALSRYREYSADRGAVSITGNPMALASALKTISNSMESTPKKDLRNANGVNALMISPVKSKFSNLISTHPRTEKRIERLQKITKEMEQ